MNTATDIAAGPCEVFVGHHWRTAEWVPGTVLYVDHDGPYAGLVRVKYDRQETYVEPSRVRRAG